MNHALPPFAPSLARRHAGAFDPSKTAAAAGAFDEPSARHASRAVFASSLPIGVLRMSAVRRGLIRALRAVDATELAHEIANWYRQASAQARMFLLARLLRPVGPLASLVVAGGVFARFALREHTGSQHDVPVADDDLPRIEANHVRQLIEYVGQADSHLVEVVATVLAQDLASIRYLSDGLIGAINAQLRAAGVVTRPALD